MAPLRALNVGIGRDVTFRPAKEIRFNVLDQRLAAVTVLLVSITKIGGSIWAEARSKILTMDT